MFINDGSPQNNTSFLNKPDEYQPVRIDCRVQTSGNLLECMRSKPRLCQHALDLDGAYICNHPLKREIVARTLRACSDQPQMDANET